MPVRPKVVAFDIIGTTFSLEPLRSRLVALGLPPLALDLLYATTLRDLFALAATDRIAPFPQVMAACLDEVLARQGLSATPERKQDLIGGLTTLPPHEDAAAAFATLREAGLRVVALSNGAAATTRGLLEAGGLAPFVERVLSIEEVGLSKPRAEVYLHAVRAADVDPGEMALVATHPWDIHGARAAGLTGAFVARERPYSPVLMPPDLAGETLLDVARAIVAL